MSPKIGTLLAHSQGLQPNIASTLGQCLMSAHVSLDLTHADSKWHTPPSLSLFRHFARFCDDASGEEK